MNAFIDTNILIAANGHSEQAVGEYQLACINFLEAIKTQNGRVSVDASNLIFDEYIRYCNHSRQPSTGDAFFKWLYLNQGYEEICEKVDITLDDERVFVEFPNDVSLNSFDKSDRKFVAVALTSHFNPTIYNATDCDWKTFNARLATHNVVIHQLCPDLLLNCDEF